MNLFHIAMKIASEEMNIEKALQLIPKESHSAFKKAYNWKPRSKCWTWSINKVMKAVADGRKPLAYGFRSDVLDSIAAKYNLESNGETAYLPQNTDIANLMAWIDSSSLPPSQAHWIRGILLGYSLDDINRFAKQY
jgi:hypothetical protein